MADELGPGLRRRSRSPRLGGRRVRGLLPLPFVFGMAVLLFVLDVAISLYQAASFPFYGIAPVRRRDHFSFDRVRLPCLNLAEKARAAYYSYANGLLSYSTEIVARTEHYWCPVDQAGLPPEPAHRRRLSVDRDDGLRCGSRARILRGADGIAVERRRAHRD